MLQIVLVWHPSKKASLDFGLKRGSFYSDGHLHKGPEGIPREADEASEGPVGLCVWMLSNGLLGGNHCLKWFPSPSFLPHLSNNKDSCQLSVKTSIFEFWEWGQYWHEQAGAQSASRSIQGFLGLAKLSFLGQMLGETSKLALGYTHMCAHTYTSKQNK